MDKTLIRIVAVYLWWLSIIFFITLIFGSSPFMADGTFLGEVLIRHPYQYDFEFMFSILFLVWGIFLWRAANNISVNRTLIQFSAWAFITHAGVFIIIGIFKQEIFLHALMDSVWWIVAGALLFKALKSTIH